MNEVGHWLGVYGCELPETCRALCSNRARLSRRVSPVQRGSGFDVATLAGTSTGAEFILTNRGPTTVSRDERAW